MMILLHICPRCGCPILNPALSLCPECIGEIHAAPLNVHSIPPRLRLPLGEKARGLVARFGHKKGHVA